MGGGVSTPLRRPLDVCSNPGKQHFHKVDVLISQVQSVQQVQQKYSLYRTYRTYSVRMVRMVRIVSIGCIVCIVRTHSMHTLLQHLQLYTRSGRADMCIRIRMHSAHRRVSSRRGFYASRPSTRGSLYWREGWIQIPPRPRRYAYTLYTVRHSDTVVMLYWIAAVAHHTSSPRTRYAHMLVCD